MRKSWWRIDNDMQKYGKGDFQLCNQRGFPAKNHKKMGVQLYMDKLRSIYLNLDQPEFLKQILSGDIVPQTVAFMTHQEINPGQWKEWIDKKMQRDASKFNDNIQASTDMYTCKKCRSTRCTYYEMQTRSADEPATIFVTCLDCGKHFRA